VSFAADYGADPAADHTADPSSTSHQTPADSNLHPLIDNAISISRERRLPEINKPAFHSLIDDAICKQMRTGRTQRRLHSIVRQIELRGEEPTAAENAEAVAQAEREASVARIESQAALARLSAFLG
jgi:hypothetical protein